MFSSGKGAGFQAGGTDQGQLNTAYAQTQAGIKQQQDFVNALNAQNGLANQTSVFGQQQGLANQLQGLANGVGPNPAQAQLAQNTAANTANQAALMAGQRGSSQNAGMIARQAAMQGAQNQQNSVGQAATLQAQQQLAAMQQLQNQQSSMGNMANTQVGQQQAGLRALNQNSLQQQANLLGMQANQNSVNAAIAGGNARGQQNMFGGLMGGIGSGVMGMFGGGEGEAAGGGMGSLIGNQSGDAASSLVGGGVTALANGGQVKRYAEGGQPKATPTDFNPLSGDVAPEVVSVTPADPAQPQSNVGKLFNTGIDTKIPEVTGGGGGGDPTGGMGQMANLGMKGLMSWGEHEALPYIGDFLSGLGGGLLGTTEVMAGGAGDAILLNAPTAIGAAGETAVAMAPAAAVGTATVAAAKGGKLSRDHGKVPVLLSPGERKLPPSSVDQVKKGANPMAEGQKVPGKPKVGGSKNSYSNDTVKDSVPEGTIIIPRSVTMGKDPEKNAAAFVRACLAKNGHLPKRGK